MTDKQRAKVDAAENQVARYLDHQPECPTVLVAGSTLTLPPERQFADVPSMQRYVDLVLALPWVRESWAMATQPVVVRARKGNAKAHYYRGEIAIPTMSDRTTGRTWWAMREMVLLHEIAHHLTPFAAHGPEFTGCLAELVDGLIGPEVAFLLRLEYSALQVRIA